MQPNFLAGYIGQDDLVNAVIVIRIARRVLEVECDLATIRIHYDRAVAVKIGMNRRIFTTNMPIEIGAWVANRPV